MGLTREQLHERSVKKLFDYIKEHGEQISKSLTIGNTYPVCIKDICVDTVGIFEDKIVFGDFDISKNEFKSIRRTAADQDLGRTYLDAVLKDMIETDSKKK